MIHTAEIVMKEIHACAAFIQSDEMTFIVSPCKENQEFYYGGRTPKLLSTVAALTTQTFLRQILKISGNNELPERPITFDARIGIWNSIEESFSLLLWRSYGLQHLQHRSSLSASF